MLLKTFFFRSFFLVFICGLCSFLPCVVCTVRSRRRRWCRHSCRRCTYLYIVDDIAESLSNGNFIVYYFAVMCGGGAGRTSGWHWQRRNIPHMHGLHEVCSQRWIYGNIKIDDPSGNVIAFKLVYGIPFSLNGKIVNRISNARRSLFSPSLVLSLSAAACLAFRCFVMTKCSVDVAWSEHTPLHTTHMLHHRLSTPQRCNINIQIEIKRTKHKTAECYRSFRNLMMNSFHLIVCCDVFNSITRKRLRNQQRIEGTHTHTHTRIHLPFNKSSMCLCKRWWWCHLFLLNLCSHRLRILSLACSIEYSLFRNWIHRLRSFYWIYEND